MPAYPSEPPAVVLERTRRAAGGASDAGSRIACRTQGEGVKERVEGVKEITP